MPRQIPTKTTFGTIKIHNIGPALPANTPRAINLFFSFEEGLKLQIGIQQLLLKLNGYNRNLKEAKQQGICLCAYTDNHSLTINEGRLGQRKSAKEARPIDDLDEKLREYIEEIEATSLSQNTKDTYILHATNFTRWCRGEFVPGSRKG